MKVYLAARYSRRDELREHKSILEKHGIEVTSRWLLENEPLDSKMGQHTEDFYVETANIDIEDIDVADAVVFFSEEPFVGTPRGGRHVEFGYAHAIGRPIYVIGPKENIFHYRDRVYNYENLESFIKDYDKRNIVH